MINRIFNLLFKKPLNNEHELELHTITIVAAFFCLLAHVLLLAIHIAAQTPFLILLNLCSILVYSICFYLAQKGRYRICGLIITIDITLYSFISILLLGTETYTLLYFMLVLILQFVIPYASGRLRAAMGAAVWAAMLASVFVGFYCTPLYSMGRFEKLLAVFNVHLALITIVVALSVDKFTRRVLAHNSAERMEDLQDLAYTDALTTLYNRRYADDFFRTFSKSAGMSSWCVAMMDIDNFKQVNDLHGHQAGDAVLRSIAQTMGSCLRSSDLVFRWGGEEFLLLLKDTGLDGAFFVTDQMRRTIAETPIETQAGPLYVTVTVGIAALDAHAIHESIARSDRKLYEGKRAGKNMCVK